MRDYVRTWRNKLLSLVRSSSWIYRAAKRAQPAYLRWLFLRTSVLRAFIATSGMARLVQNPTRTAVASILAADEQDAAAAGLTAVSLHPDTRAHRTLPPGLDGHLLDVFSRVQCERSGAATIYTLSDGRIWGSDGAIVSRDRRLVGDLSPIIRLPAEAHPMFGRPIIRKPRRLNGRLGIATGPSPANLSHWLLGVLPRISLLQQWDPALKRTDWILSPPLGTPFQLECLRRFDVPRSKVIETRPDTFLEGREIVAPSFSSAAYGVPSWFLSDLQRRFDDVAPAHRVPRLYVSRMGARGRRVDNETAVITMLTSYAFQAVRLESLSFLAQVALFKAAEIVVAPHGAGLSHLAFARTGTAVVELFSPSYINPMYWCLSDELGLRYRCCVGTTKGNRGQHDLVRDDINVDVELLAATVQSLIPAGARS